MFFVYRGLQRRPTGAGRRSQAVFRANLHARKRRGRKKQKKATELSFSGAQTPGSLPQIHVQTAFCAPSRPFLSPSGHHGHTRPRSSPPTTSPACSRKQSSIVLHFGSVRCLRSSGANVEKMPRWIVSKSLRSAMCAPLAAPAANFSHQNKPQ